MSVPTVKIANSQKPGEYLIINESDFDPSKHTLWTEAPVAAPAPAPAPVVANQIDAYDAPVDEAAPKRSHHAKRSR